MFSGKKFKYKPLQRVKPEILKKLLVNYPDKQEAQYVISGFTNGFRLGLEREPLPRDPCENSAKALKNEEVTSQLIAEEIEMGHMLGPFDEPPLEGMVYSPIHLVDKAGDPNKSRLIHNLAYPYNDQSVNRCIPQSESSVQYHYVDELIDLALQLGDDLWGCRVDFSHGKK